MEAKHVSEVINGRVVNYQVVNGTYYKQETPELVIQALESARRCKRRVRVVYGDTETGYSWSEVHDVAGYVGRSMGFIKIPLLVHNRRSLGGGGLLDHCILGIRSTLANRDGTYRWYYRHPLYRGQE